jgi:predicted nucleotidyltransferase
MMDTRLIMKELKRHLAKNLDMPVREVVLFGSQSRGGANENSDYDVLIVIEGDYSGTDENRVLDLCYDIDLKYNILLDVHLISVRELGTLRGKQPIFVNALKSGLYA